MSKTIIQEYYEYCDGLVNDWIAKNSNLPKNDPFLQNSTILSGKPYFNIMPEPFLGNPDNCSIVMINLNPGYTIGDDVKLSRQNTSKRFADNNLKGYSDFAKPFPYLSNPEIHPAGADWWEGRKEYLDRLVQAYTGKNTTRFPFALELCPWHSNKWEEAKVKIDDAVYDRMIQRALIPAMYAVGKSEAKIAVVVGKAAVPVIEEAGFKLIQSWGPEKRVLGKKKGKLYDYLANNISFPNNENPEMKYPQTMKHSTVKLANGERIKEPLGESDAEVFYRYFKANLKDLNIDKELISELPATELKVLSIFKTGSNNTPGPEFYYRGIEQTILDFIKKH